MLARLGSTRPTRAPLPGRRGRRQMEEQLLKRKTALADNLVRWQGCFSADDSREPVERLAPFPERIAEYEPAAIRRPPP